MSNKIVINAISLLSKLTGIGKYTFEICKRLDDLQNGTEIQYFYGYYSRQLYKADDPPSGRFIKKVKKLLSQNYPVKRTTREALLFLSRFSRRSFDLYWEPNIVPIRHIRSKYLVTTIHDFSFYRYPDCLPKENREYLQKHFAKNIRKCDRIITGSNYVKDEIVDQLNYDASSINVIYHGIDHECFRRHDESLLRQFGSAHNLPEKFILFVGSIEPRKNLKKALLAYDSLPAGVKRKYKFVLAGFSGWKNAEVMDIIRRTQGDVTYLGYLTNLELAYLYNLASLFIYPSLYEGFGLPPLEAMACGAPVIVSNTSSMPEICGDAAHYVEPLSIESIADGILRVIDDADLQGDLARRGIERVKAFNWDTAARKHSELFFEVIGR